MLSERSKQVRRDLIMLSKANGGYHYGGSFSCIEILLALFDFILKPEDRFILSKGHACWGLYVLLRERGLHPKLEGHPCLDLANGIHWTTGSLGHGLPAGVGMALARKRMGLPGKVYVLMSDGECQEGTTWESMLMAAHHKLDNLVAIIDYNGLQACGTTSSILPVDSIHNVFKEVGWLYHIVEDGHNVDHLKNWIEMVPVNYPPAPRLILAVTVKGKGVSFMEGDASWHARWPNAKEVELMLKELQ